MGKRVKHVAKTKRVLVPKGLSCWMTCGNCLASAWQITSQSFLEIPSGYIWLYKIAMENGSFIDVFL
jgi:hypothetical protein